MRICKLRDRPFDVLTKKRAVNMTSVEWTTRLFKGCEVRSKNEGLTTEIDEKIRT